MAERDRAKWPLLALNYNYFRADLPRRVGEHFVVSGDHYSQHPMWPRHFRIQSDDKAITVDVSLIEIGPEPWLSVTFEVGDLEARYRCPDLDHHMLLSLAENDRPPQSLMTLLDHTRAALHELLDQRDVRRDEATQHKAAMLAKADAMLSGLLEGKG